MGKMNYEFGDKQIEHKVNYYRLTIIDVNGNEVFSNVVTLYQDKDFCEFFPNPTTGLIHFMSHNKDQKYEIFTEIGLSILKGENTPNHLDISYLTQEIYYLEVGSKRVKLIKI